jgi:hypothetical protein
VSHTFANPPSRRSPTEPPSKTKRPNPTRSEVRFPPCASLANVTVSCTRTHRERKEAYTKSLEREVVQLRANEAQILQETRRLYAEITTMKRVMAAHGIEVPTIEPNATDQNQPGVAVSLDVTSPNEAFDLSIRVSNNKQKHRHIHVHRHASPGTNQKSTPSDAFDTSHSSECTHTTPPFPSHRSNSGC